MELNRVFFFSDLDDTLIQTERKTDFDKSLFAGAYNREGKVSSYIYEGTKIFIEHLIQGNIVIVPTTARNLSSYQRTIFYKHYNIDLAILNFSGVILDRGQIDKEWNSFVVNNYTKLSVDIETILIDVIEFFKKNLEVQYTPVVKSIDNQYISIYNRKFRDEVEITTMIGELIKQFIYKNSLDREFYVYQNGASFGILPKFLNKKNGVKYLIDKYQPILTLGAGDNVSDMDFMNLMNFSIIPNNTPLNNMLNYSVAKSIIKKKRENEKQISYKKN